MSMLVDSERKAHAAVEALYPSYCQMLQELVRIPSPIGCEGDAQAFIAKRMAEIGLEVDVFEIEPNRLVGLPGFNATPQNYRGRPCVVGRRAGKSGGRSLILNAHIDTAPAGDVGVWQHAPFSGAIEDNRLYGRGAWDDKAGCAECLMAVEALHMAGIALEGDLTVMSVIEDESTGNGTLACLERGYVADGAIIVDGNWPERLTVTHMGQLWFRLKLRGRSAPACVSSRGCNPLKAIGLLMDGMDSWIEAKNNAVKAPWGAAQRPAFINVGCLQCGHWPGSVPLVATIEGQYGFLPPQTADKAKAELKEAIENIARDPRWPLDSPPAFEFWGLTTDPLNGDPSNPIAGLVRDTVKRLRGKDVLENVITGHCDLRHFQAPGGRRPIPACLYGPGGGKNAHIEDEYFMLEHLAPVTQNLASMVLSWCR
jgi:acetylornithine deacetylase